MFSQKQQKTQLEYYSNGMRITFKRYYYSTKLNWMNDYTIIYRYATFQRFFRSLRSSKRVLFAAFAIVEP